MKLRLVALLALAACNAGNPSTTDGTSETGTGSDGTGNGPTAPTSTTNTPSEPGTTTGPMPTTGETLTDPSTTGDTPPGDHLVGHCGARTGRYFPENSWIYADVTDAPVRPDSAATTAWLAAHGGWGNDNHFQIDTSLVINEADASTPRATRTPDDPVPYGSDCDPGVQMPLPDGGRIEGLPDYVCPGRVEGEYEGDCHLIVADFAGGFLYEAFRATYVDGQYYTECDVAWDMTRDVWGPPPAPGSTLPPVEEYQWGIGRDCTGPDAAGFPIAPLLFTVGDVMSGRVEHAIRFILPNDRMQRAPSDDVDGPMYVWPATHAGGPQAIDPSAPIYGSRWRLRADFDPASRGLDPANPVVQAVVWGLQHHGMLLADGGNIALTAESSDGCGTSWDDLWGDNAARVLDGIQPEDFDVIDVGGPEMGYDCVRNPDR
ncbi:hypothetical protein [Nannocystis radixulma]|uniref:Lipoprotein n=1 Tax=Nannocystis radixulma TaxID=2995305 RepID=A0ABT5BF56_9BACT|nr:hypothetical protein [Nannocystis radixulma]MDC0672781.1 hypothetical protein [Nannocystis radixulma]MDC0674803.1 hypothetical protein [Nannocystis radixulma]